LVPGQVLVPRQLGEPTHVWLTQVVVPSHDAYIGHVGCGEQVTIEPAHVSSAVHETDWQVSIAAQVAFRHVYDPGHVEVPWQDAVPTIVGCSSGGQVTDCTG
jgi:hypothetical protein